MEQYAQHPMKQSEPSREDIDKWRSSSVGATGSESNSSAGFDCNICLDFVQDPVVTFCGHLYCWPCIYKWIQSQKAASEDFDQQPQCPVCKADVSQNTLIPLYGRGQSRKPSDTSKGVPRRPSGPGCGVHTLIASTTTQSSHPSQQFHHHHHHHHGYPHQQVHHPYDSMAEYPASPTFGFEGTTTFHPMMGMFGEMIYARIFGNSQTTLYTYPNTYSVAATSSARVRRADRSLSRFSFFLCCCIIWCLLLF